MFEINKMPHLNAIHVEWGNDSAFREKIKFFLLIEKSIIGKTKNKNIPSMKSK